VTKRPTSAKQLVDALPVQVVGNLSPSTWRPLQQDVQEGLLHSQRLRAQLPGGLQRLRKRALKADTQRKWLRYWSFGLLGQTRTKPSRLQIQLNRLENRRLSPALHIRTFPADALVDRWSAAQQAFDHLLRSHRIWRIDQESGAVSKQLDLSRCKLSIFPPEHLDLQPYPFSFRVGRQGISLHPLGVFSQRYGEAAQFIPADQLQIALWDEPFREFSPPNDATQLFATWEYLNADGQPDANMPQNRRIYVLRYARLRLTFGNLKHQRLELLISRYQAAVRFKETVSAFYQELGVMPTAD